MDFGVVSHKQTSPCLVSSEHPTDEKGHAGSMNLKHQRSAFAVADDSWRLPKMPRPGEVDFSASKATQSFAAFGRSNLWPSPVDDGQKMLSFSSADPHVDGGGSGKSIVFSSCEDEQYGRGGGGGVNGGLRGPFARMRGPFTPSQWMELEHQALIYKHFVANVPIPSNLLVPLKRSLYSYGSPQSYASNFLGWGHFHLGFSGSNDPEPGRCRRTDGKKWRCSRDAVPDQKYCERHINRGRHRSRKPVEGLNGHAVSGSTTTTTPKVVPAIASSSSSASVMSSNSRGAMHHQFANTSAASTDHLVNRSQGFQGLSLIPPIQKQHNPFEESSLSEFGIVTSDSLLNPSERMSYINTNNSDSFLRFDPKESDNQQNPVRHFIDDWPKDHSELKSDWTQLSMSIPVAQDFQSPSSSPAQEKSTTVSALRLSHDLDPIPMSLGVSHVLHEPVQKQSSSPASPWLPVSWGSSMGGPLGEVLSSHQVGSSPTDVLQRSTFVSLSNSSSGSSPRSSTDNKKATENGGFCNDLLGSAAARVTSAAIPSL